MELVRWECTRGDKYLWQRLMVSTPGPTIDDLKMIVEHSRSQELRQAAIQAIVRMTTDWQSLFFLLERHRELALGSEVVQKIVERILSFKLSKEVLIRLKDCCDYRTQIRVMISRKLLQKELTTSELVAVLCFLERARGSSEDPPTKALILRVWRKLNKKGATHSQLSTVVQRSFHCRHQAGEILLDSQGASVEHLLPVFIHLPCMRECAWDKMRENGLSKEPLKKIIKEVRPLFYPAWQELLQTDLVVEDLYFAIEHVEALRDEVYDCFQICNESTRDVLSCIVPESARSSL